MDPFPVICETCRARLKVRSENAIGEIHACPKCGSMVQIQPPAGWTAAAVAAASAVTAVASTPAVEAASAVPSFEDAAAMIESTTAPEIIPAAEAVPLAEPAVAAATPAWSPLAWSGIVGTIVLVGGGIVMALWPEGNSAAVAPAPAGDTAASTLAATEPAPDVPISESASASASKLQADNDQMPVAVEATTPEAAVDNQRPTPLVATIAPEPSPPVTSDSVVTETPAVENEAVNVASELAANDDGSGPGSNAPAKAAERSPVLRFDPLDFDPSQLSLSTNTTTSRNQPVGSIAADAAVEVAAATGEPDADVKPEDMLPPPLANPAVAVRVGAVAAQAVEPRRVADQLALEIESLEISGMPLARFLETISDMASVPITVDPMALDLAGVSPSTAVSIKTADVTLEKILRDTLAKHRLAFIEGDGHVTVTLPDADRRITKEYSVADLIAPDQNDAAALVRALETFVAPSTWQAAGGTGTVQIEGTKLRVEQAKRVHHELLIFSERLRLARGLPPQSRYPAKLLSIESPYAKLETKLAAKTMFTMLPWTRLADVVRWWQEAAGVTILVDWRSLADVQLGASTPISCSANDRPWVEALADILEPLNLGWYAVDGETIAVTSRDALAHLERVEFHSVPKALRDQFTSQAALVESLQAELEQSGPDQSAAARSRMHLDGPSGRLIVRGTPAVHRHLTQRLRPAVGASQ